MNLSSFLMLIMDWMLGVEMDLNVEIYGVPKKIFVEKMDLGRGLGVTMGLSLDGEVEEGKGKALNNL
jgi:hypothetical protein